MKKFWVCLTLILSMGLLTGCAHDNYSNGGYYARPATPIYYGGTPIARPAVKPAHDDNEALIRQQKMQNRINRRNNYHHH